MRLNGPLDLQIGAKMGVRYGLFLVVVTTFLGVGCDGNQTAPIFPPNFKVESVKTDHGAFTACWYVTIRNDGGPGSMLVQKWIGSSDKSTSRTVVYNERLTLRAFESKTIKIEWTHGMVAALVDLAIYGPSDGIDFLP